jgi:hypothetical protein
MTYYTEARAEEAAEAEARRLNLSARRLILPVYGRDGVSGAGGANPNPNPNAVAWLGQAGASANTWVRRGWRALRNAAKGRFGAGSLGIVRLLTGESCPVPGFFFLPP